MPGTQSLIALAGALVGLGRLELPTSPLSGVRSSHLSYRPGKTGGAGRDRTGDLLNANQALSQLSYSPLLGVATKAGGATNLPGPQSLIPNPQYVIEADWTLPAGARPNEQSKFAEP